MIGINIGDIFKDTEGYGTVKVIDIFISITDQERVYLVRTEKDFIEEFLCYGVELTC